MARRTKSYRKTGYRARAAGAYGKYKGKAKSVLGMSTPYVVGLALGLSDLDKMIPGELKLGIAIAPNSVTGMLGKTGGQARAVAQGMLLGDLIQARTGFTLGGGGSVGGSSSGAGW